MGGVTAEQARCLFAYGILRSGEIAFPVIKPFVRDITPATVRGNLLVSGSARAGKPRPQGIPAGATRTRRLARSHRLAASSAATRPPSEWPREVHTLEARGIEPAGEPRAQLRSP